MLYVIILGTQISQIPQILELSHTDLTDLTDLEYDTMDSFVHVFLAKINK